MINYYGRSLPVNDHFLDQYRLLTGMDIEETAVAHYASNEGVKCEDVSDDVLAAIVEKGMRLEIEVATEM